MLRIFNICQIECCGLLNYTDWFKKEWANNTHSVPKSCCKDNYNCLNVNLNLLNITGIWDKVKFFFFQINFSANFDFNIIQGCYSRIRETIEGSYTLIGGLGFASATLIFLGSVLSFWLASNIRHNRYQQFQQTKI